MEIQQYAGMHLSTALICLHAEGNLELQGYNGESGELEAQRSANFSDTILYFCLAIYRHWIHFKLCTK